MKVEKLMTVGAWIKSWRVNKSWGVKESWRVKGSWAVQEH